MRISIVLILLIILVEIFLYSSHGLSQCNKYIGSITCLSCHIKLHPDIINEWEKSPHHLGMKSVSGYDNIPGNFIINSLFTKKEVVCLIGFKSGRFSYIGSNFQILPMEWSSTDSIWTERKTVDAAQRCFGCHSTGYYITQKKFSEPGVGCEACHGPGEKHIESGGLKETIINPATLSRDRNCMVCGQCHSLGTDLSGLYPFPVMNTVSYPTANECLLEPFQPGQDLTLGFMDSKPKKVIKGKEYSLLVQAPDYFSKQICTDCHDPHGRTGNPHMLIDGSNKICLRCHGERFKNPGTHWNADKELCWNCHEYAHTH